jgi:hypothetical protein
MHAASAKILEITIAEENNAALLNAIRMDTCLEHYHELPDQDLLDIITSQKTYFKTLQLID